MKLRYTDGDHLNGTCLVITRPAGRRKQRAAGGGFFSDNYDVQTREPAVSILSSFFQPALCLMWTLDLSCVQLHIGQPIHSAGCRLQKAMTGA